MTSPSDESTDTFVTRDKGKRVNATPPNEAEKILEGTPYESAKEPPPEKLKSLLLPTGAHRNPKGGKGRYDLISPHMMRRLAIHHEAHAGDHPTPDDWEKGVPLSDLLSCAARHIYNRLLGRSKEDNLAAAVWNLAAVIHIEEEVKAGRLPKELLDTRKEKANV